MKKFWIKLAVSLALGALFIWLAFSNQDVKWDEVKDSLLQVPPRYLFFYFLMFCGFQVIRALRWGILLKPLGQVRLGRLLSVSFLGFMALMLLPLRLGEFARPILIAEKGKIRASAALGTVVVERIIDSLVMAALLVVILFLIPQNANLEVDLRFWAPFILAGFLGLLVLLVLTVRYRVAALRLFARLFKPFPTRIQERLLSMLDSFILGMKALPDAKQLLGFLLLTGLFWFVAGLGMYYMFGAFEGLSHLGLVEAFTALSVLCVGLMIPAGPGMMGNFHYFVVLSLSLFLDPATNGADAMAYAIVVHAVQLGQHLLFGLPFLFVGQRNLWRLMVPVPTDPDPELGPSPPADPNPPGTAD